jgi:hypothetical protein
MATAAVRQYGMFGADLGFSTIGVDQASDDYNAAVDRLVKKILDVSSITLTLGIGLIYSRVRAY